MGFSTWFWKVSEVSHATWHGAEGKGRGGEGQGLPGIVVWKLAGSLYQGHIWIGASSVMWFEVECGYPWVGFVCAWTMCSCSRQGKWPVCMLSLSHQLNNAKMKEHTVHMAILWTTILSNVIITTNSLYCSCRNPGLQYLLKMETISMNGSYQQQNCKENKGEHAMCQRDRVSCISQISWNVKYSMVEIDFLHFLHFWKCRKCMLSVHNEDRV